MRAAAQNQELSGQLCTWCCTSWTPSCRRTSPQRTRSSPCSPPHNNTDGHWCTLGPTLQNNTLKNPLPRPRVQNLCSWRTDCCGNGGTTCRRTSSRGKTTPCGPNADCTLTCACRRFQEPQLKKIVSNELTDKRVTAQVKVLIALKWCFLIKMYRVIVKCGMLEKRTKWTACVASNVRGVCSE